MIEKKRIRFWKSFITHRLSITACLVVSLILGCCGVMFYVGLHADDDHCSFPKMSSDQVAEVQARYDDALRDITSLNTSDSLVSVSDSLKVTGWCTGKMCGGEARIYSTDKPFDQIKALFSHKLETNGWDGSQESRGSFYNNSLKTAHVSIETPEDFYGTFSTPLANNLSYGQRHPYYYVVFFDYAEPELPCCC